MTSKLEADSIYLEFKGRKILSGVYMLFETGKVTGILGRNGAGKSCLMKIIFGSLQAQYANIRVNGETVFSLYQKDNFLKYLPQFNIFPGFLKLSQILLLFDYDPLKLFADFPEFEPSLNCSFGQLSFGQKRLFETYLFIKANATFILLDEPFSYLMPVHVEKIKALIREEKQSKGIIITDHLYIDLLDIADSLYLISDTISRKIHDHAELQKYGYLK